LAPCFFSGTLRRMKAATTPRRWALAGALLAALLGLAAGCRFMPQGGHWIEAHGSARAKRIAGAPSGVQAIGMDDALYLYPTDWARPWRALGGQQVKALAASTAAFYVISNGGEVVRIVNGVWSPLAGSVAWGVTALAASPEDKLYAVVGGHLRRVEGADLRDAPCGDINVGRVAARGDEVYVIDGAGTLFRGTAAGCMAASSPGPLRDVAAFTNRLVAISRDGAVWRQRGQQNEGAWRALPAIRKYRSGRYPYLVGAQQVSLSATSTWIVDDESSVFLLSDELAELPAEHAR
jgi:hypothetical protein